MNRGLALVLCMSIACGHARSNATSTDTSSAHAGSAAQQKIMALADALNRAAIAGDYAVMADATYPRLVEAAGGRPAMIAELKRTFDELTRDGYIVNRVRVISASVPIVAGAELHSLVISHQDIESPMGAARLTTYMIAASSDRGETWTFVNVPNRAPQAIKKIFPVWNDALKLPES